MITILGATGNVGGKIADVLIKKGEPLRLIARSSDRLRRFVGTPAETFAGDANNIEFLVTVFKDADAVFTLIPPDPKASNFMQYADKIGESIARALEIAKVKYVVNLSSIGAELPEGTGPIKGLHNMEERLNRIKGLNVLHLRAPYFMENLLWNVDLIKSKGIMGSAIRGDLRMPMIATRDIAAYAADRLVNRDFVGPTVHDLQGRHDLTMIDAAAIIGNKIEKPGLFYVTFPYDEAEKGMVAMGLSPDMGKQYIEMSKAFNNGLIKSGGGIKKISTATSFETFCDDVFAPVYRQKMAA
jgi:uncharacterized protein YbjT (DUF2867 family)